MESGRAKLQAGDYAGAMAQADLALAAKANDEAARHLKADAAAKKNQLDILDTELERLCIELGVSKPSWLNMPGAKGDTRYLTEMDFQTIDQYSKRVSDLEQHYKAGGWLNQNNRGRIIDQLNKNLKNR